MSDPHLAREADTPGGGPQSRAGEQRPSLWHPGALFHAAARYPRRPNAARVDRLAEERRPDHPMGDRPAEEHHPDHPVEDHLADHHRDRPAEAHRLDHPEDRHHP